MCPSPEVAMAITAVVPLYPEAQWVRLNSPPIERDLAGKHCVGVRRPRESNPALIAQRGAECRTIVNVPGKRLPANFQGPAAEPLADFIISDSEVEWILPPGAEVQPFQRKPLNEALRFSIDREPCRPDLHGHPARVTRATPPAGVHQQISEPPRPAPIRESHSDKPDFIAAAGRK